MEDVEARDRAIDILERHLAGGDTERRPSIPTRNDKLGRTKAELIETMRRVARSG
jgi:hypothetical protein